MHEDLVGQQQHQQKQQRGVDSMEQQQQQEEELHFAVGDLVRTSGADDTHDWFAALSCVPSFGSKRQHAHTTHTTSRPQVMVAGPGGVLQERKVVEINRSEGGGGKGRKRTAFYRLQSTDAPNRKKVRRGSYG